MIEARNPTGTRASAAAASRSERRTEAESTVGSVFGMATIAQKPPAAAAARARLEILLVLLAGRAQVDVGIDERREQVAPLSVHDFGALGRLERARRPDLGDLAAAHEHVLRAIEPFAGIEHVRAAHEHVGQRGWTG